jgi:hypothetical protein
VGAQGLEFLLEGLEGPQAVVLLRKPRMQIGLEEFGHVSLFKLEKKLLAYTAGRRAAP